MAGLTGTQAAGLGALIGSFLTFIIVGAIIYYVLLVVAWWKLFSKAGEKGWKSIIPIYNFYVQCRLTWSTKFFWIIFIVGLLASIFSGLAPTLASPISGIFSIASLVLAIAFAVFLIISEYRLSKAYGHGAGFTVGLVIFNFIFMLVLGLGKSEYKGNVYLDSKN